MFEQEIQRRKKKVEKYKTTTVKVFDEYKKFESRREVFENPKHIEDLYTFCAIGATDVVIDAVKKGYMKAVLVEEDGEARISMEFLPIKNLPPEIGHMFSVDNRISLDSLNDKENSIFGNKEGFTYLQTTDFIVEGYFENDFYGGASKQQTFLRLYYDSAILQQERDVYLDPECIHTTPEEYPHSFIVNGGIPKRALTKMEVVKLPKQNYSSFIDDDEWLSDEDCLSEEELASQIERDTQRLIEFLKTQNN